jgi:hypothetical protein
MPHYVSGKDLKTNKERIFNPSESDYMSKKKVIEKTINILQGENRRRKLRKALNKMSAEDVVMIGMLTEQVIRKEVKKALLQPQLIVE